MQECLEPATSPLAVKTDVLHDRPFMAELFLLRVLRHPQGNAVPFLVIGGHAVIALGHVRATFDYDFLTSESHRHALNTVFEDIGYTLFAANGPFVQWTAPPGLPPVDIMVVDDATFVKLETTSRSVAIAGQQVRIPSPENLVALKLHASRQRTRESASHQDWLDIVQIVRRQRLDLEEPSFRALLVRYGGPETPDILSRLLLQGTGDSA